MPETSLTARPQDLEAALRLAPQLYDAVIHPERWPQALSEIGHFLEAPQIQLCFARISESKLITTYTWGLPEEVVKFYLSMDNELIFSDVPLARHMRLPNKPAHCRELVSEEELHASEFYRKALKPFNVEYRLVCMAVLEEHDLLMSIGAFRPPTAPTFTGQETERMQLLAPHLRSAGKVAAELYKRDGAFQQLSGLLDAMAVAVLVVDRFATVRYRNPAAAALLGRSGELREQGGRLVHASSETSHQLRAAVISSLSQAAAGRKPEPIYLPLPRAGELPLQATVLPIATATSSGLPDLDGAGRVAVFVTDPSAVYETSEERLQRLLGLTAAEAGVLRALARGTSVERIAQASGRSVATIRNQLKSVMERTGVHRQSDLVALVLRSEPLVRT